MAFMSMCLRKKLSILEQNTGWSISIKAQRIHLNFNDVIQYLGLKDWVYKLHRCQD